MFWVDQVGNNPAPFTLITANDVRTGKWIPTHYLSQGDRQKLMDYTGKLEANGRYSLVIWPPHCLVGSSGMNVQEEVFQAFLAWEQESKRPVNYVNKGYNPFTEHYSVIQADVPDPADASTQPNLNLIRVIDDASKKPNTVVLIGGQALSHCVANSVTDLATHMDLTGKKIVLVRDWCSNVPGFEQLGDDFLAKLPGLGIEILNSSDLV
jgi:nicotinamidase-related amidase